MKFIFILLLTVFSFVHARSQQEVLQDVPGLLKQLATATTDTGKKKRYQCYLVFEIILS